MSGGTTHFYNVHPTCENERSAENKWARSLIYSSSARMVTFWSSSPSVIPESLICNLWRTRIPRIPWVSNIASLLHCPRPFDSCFQHVKLDILWISITSTKYRTTEMIYIESRSCFPEVSAYTGLTVGNCRKIRDWKSQNWWAVWIFELSRCD